MYNFLVFAYVPIAYVVFSASYIDNVVLQHQMHVEEENIEYAHDMTYCYGIETIQNTFICLSFSKNVQFFCLFLFVINVRLLITISILVVEFTLSTSLEIL